MEYRTLGRTGLHVSALGFGGAPLGIPGYLDPDGRADRDGEAFRTEALAALREALARGINYFDTAPGYGEGRSERLFGEALEAHRGNIHVATKYPFGDGTATPEQRTEGLRASLDRLRTDHVDVLLLHGGTFDDALAERILASGALDWAEEMRARGLCRWTGITAEGPSGALERLLRTGRFDVAEIAYSLIYQSTCDHQREPPQGVIPLARSLGLGVTVMRPATSGFLQKLLPAAFPGLDASAVTRLAFQFVLSTPEIDCALVGMRSAVEVRENAALAADLSARLDLKALHHRFA